MTKIIQTYWLPQNKDNGLLNSGGFTCPEIHYMSWAFSCLQLLKFYPEVELHTNQAGKEILIDLLELPYTKVHLSLETEFMHSLLPSMWAYSKIHTYSLQTEPFLHVDGDVYIWEPFDEKLMCSPLIAQNIEENLKVYNHCIETIETKLDFIPDWINSKNKKIRAYNAGIIGGSELSFYKKYTDLAFEFYEKNKSQFPSFKNSNKHIHIIPEQYLFYQLSSKMNIQVALQDEKKVDSEVGAFSQFVQIDKIPNEEKYMHVLGNYKKSKIHNNFIEFILKKEYPHYWQKIISIYQEKKILSDYIKIQLKSKSQEMVVQQKIPSIDQFKHTKLLCKQFGIKINGKEIINNEKLQDIKNFERQLINFSTKKMVKSKIETTPFNSYIKEIDKFTQKKYEDYYVFATPYHQIVTTKFNWSENLTINNWEEIEKINPYKSNIIIYLDMFYYSDNCIWLSDSLLHLLEKIKSKPTTIKELLNLENNENENNISLILKKWHAYGLIYISKSDFIIQEPSKVYTDSQNNIKNQVFSCLQYIVEHYNISNYDKQIITQYEKLRKTISLREIITSLKMLNFEAHGVRANLDNLNKITVPAIAVVKLRDYLPLHVIITKITGTHVTIYNTELKDLEEYHKEYFATIWDGILILLSPVMNEMYKYSTV